MTAVTESRERDGFKLQSPPEWGIEPVPPAERKLGFVDFAVLWGDLGIGLLVLLSGSLLVPGLSLPDALLAIVIGTTIGCTLLALAGYAGSKLGAPTMVLLRPSLGLRGSYLPSLLNILQLVGWTVFEIIIMASAANAITRSMFGLDLYALWAILATAIVVLMGVGGPMVVIRQWLSKVAVWVMLATTLWLTWRLFSANDIGALWRQAGTGALPFWVGVDIVISLPVSWMPLVADYNRFAKEPRSAAFGTFIGYFITNVWFFALGALILLTSSQLSQAPTEFATAIALSAGALAIVILLVDETDNAWADLYSAAVSTQNIFPKIPQSVLIVVLGVLSLLVALALDVTQYEFFLLLMGSFFVPLFGVLLADYFVVRRRQYTAEELYETATASSRGIRWPSIAAWLAGILVFQLTNPLFLATYVPAWGQIAPPALGAFGGSIPSFAAAFILQIIVGKITTTGGRTKVEPAKGPLL